MKLSIRSLALALSFGMITACAQTRSKNDDDSMKSSDSAPEGSSSSARTATRPESERYKQAGFAVFEDDGRLWVFRAGSDNLKSFREKGEPAKRVTLIGVGPDGMTVMGAERETLDAYLGGSP